MRVCPLVLASLLISVPANAEGPKDPGSATALSGLGAGVGLGMLFVNKDSAPSAILTTSVAIAAPSAGAFYSGRWVTPGLVIRTISAGMVVYGLLGYECWDSARDGGTPSCHLGVPRNSGGLGLALLGFAGYTGGAIWDVAFAGSYARDYNRKQASTAVTPVVLRGPTGLVPGLAISRSF